MSKLECSKQVFTPLNTLAWNNEDRTFVLFLLVSRTKVMANRDSRGHSYFLVRGEILRPRKDEHLRKHLPRMFSVSQERKLQDRRRLDTVVVVTINYANWGSGRLHHFNDLLGTLREIKVCRFWGEYYRKMET